MSTRRVGCFGGAEAQLIASKVKLILVFSEKLVDFHDKVPDF